MTELSASVQRNPWIQAWARLGFATGGIVYFVTGILAVIVAYENSGAAPGPEGAIERIGAQPFGRVLLVIVTVGLFGYAFWCCIQAVFDTDGDGNDLKGFGIRFGEFCSGLAYLSLAILSWHRLQGASPEGNRDGTLDGKAPGAHLGGAVGRFNRGGPCRSWCRSDCLRYSREILQVP